jgi:hypothetical protein
VAAVLGGGLLAVREHRTQPTPIAAAVASYQAQQLGDLRWHSSGHGTLGGLPVAAHTYQNAAGHLVLLAPEEGLINSDGVVCRGGLSGAGVGGPMVVHAARTVIRCRL